MPRLLINPAAGGGRAARLRATFGAASGVEPVEPTDVDALRAEVRRAVERGDDRVLVAGGDGTLHHAAAELADSGCALGIVPAGTGNDLARSFEIPRQPAAALRHALAATPRAVDLARVGEHWFAGVAGMGLDGDVLDWLDARGPDAPRGPWVYPWALLRTLGRYRAPQVRIEHDGGALEARVMLLAFANTPIFGGGMRVAPRAVPDDGILEVVVVREVPRLTLLRLFPRVYRGTHLRHPAVERFATGRLRLDCVESRRINGDGELLGRTGAGPITIEVRAGALQLAG